MTKTFSWGTVAINDTKSFVEVAIDMKDLPDYPCLVHLPNNQALKELADFLLAKA